ncbi:MAG: flagellar motor protein MotB [Phycisphaerae bacterium]
MLRSRKRAGPDEPPGAPEWMVTFSDCMTLLLTFFVLLLSFSSFDEEIFQKLKVIFADALPAVSQPDKQNKDAFLATQQIQHTEDISEGSEKPTSETGKQDHLKQESEPIDFRSRKVFVISSEKIFWGKGTAISLQGREVLATIASFLKQIPSRVVISECPANSEAQIANRDERRAISDSQIGLHRAWAVVEYLVKKQHLDKNWFSISAASTVDARYSILDTRQESRNDNQESRTLEIVLLERSIYH